DRDWQRMASAYPYFDLTDEERALQLMDQYLRCAGVRRGSRGGTYDARRGSSGEERGDGRDVRSAKNRGSVGHCDLVARLAPIRVGAEAPGMPIVEGHLGDGRMSLLESKEELEK